MMVRFAALKFNVAVMSILSTTGVANAQLTINGQSVQGTSNNAITIASSNTSNYQPQNNFQSCIANLRSQAIFGIICQAWLIKNVSMMDAKIWRSIAVH